MIKKDIIICTDDKLVGSIFTLTANSPEDLFDQAYALANACNELTNHKYELKFNLDVLFPEPPVDVANQLKALDEKEKKAKEEQAKKPIKPKADERIGIQ